MTEESESPTTAGVDARFGVRLSEDRMRAEVAEYSPPVGDGSDVGDEEVREALEDAGVSIAPVEDAIDDVLARIGNGESPVGVVLARGTAPVQGVDGVVDFRVRTALTIGRQEENDRIDYHDRGIVQSVAAGQLLATVTPPIEGKPGCDVTGAVLAGRPGLASVFKAGENVSVSEDGLSFSASIDGMVKYVHSVLSVSETFEIQGDVDMRTGNIDMEKGSVVVRGVVRGGFKVKAAGNIIVREEVEEAEIESGGDLEVKNGILGGDVKAGGSVFAKFARNASIKASGDVKVANNVHNCEIDAGGTVIMTAAKGVIRGGIIRCGGGVEANEIGSRTDAYTKVVIDVQYEDESVLLEEKNDLEESIRQVNLFLGGADEPEADSEEGEATDKLRQSLRTLYADLTQVRSKLAAIRRQKRQQAKSVVVAHRAVHPGTVIEIAGRSHVVKETLGPCRFYYDPDSDKVQQGSV